MSQKFSSRRFVGTPGAIEALSRNKELPSTYFERHLSGDWGDVDNHDRLVNEAALNTGARILSAYTLKDGTRIWIITEADRSVTTILLPDEY